MSRPTLLKRISPSAALWFFPDLLTLVNHFFHLLEGCSNLAWQKKSRLSSKKILERHIGLLRHCVLHWDLLLENTRQPSFFSVKLFGYSQTILILTTLLISIFSKSIFRLLSSLKFHLLCPQVVIYPLFEGTSVSNVNQTVR